MIGRMTRAGEMKKRLPVGARIAVDQHRLGAALARLAAINAALAAGTKAGVIGPWPIDLRRLAVILFEARAHFALEFFLQAERRRQHRVGIGVLSIEQRSDVGGQLARIAQHVAPIVGPHPGIVVHPRKAVRRKRCGPHLGSGRRRDRGLRPRSVLCSLASHDAGARRDAWKRVEGRRNVRGRRAEDGCARGAKLICAAVAPKRADGRDSMPARGQDVMLAIAPHAAIVGLEPLPLENVGNQLRLVLEAPAKLIAVSRLEVMLKVEMAQDALRRRQEVLPCRGRGAFPRRAIRQASPSPRHRRSLRKDLRPNTGRDRS